MTCKGCTKCSKVCPAGCISGKVKEKHEIDTTKCLKCGACMANCKFNAIIKQINYFRGIYLMEFINLTINDIPDLCS